MTPMYGDIVAAATLGSSTTLLDSDNKVVRASRGKEAASDAPERKTLGLALKQPPTLGLVGQASWNTGVDSRVMRNTPTLWGKINNSSLYKRGDATAKTESRYPACINNVVAIWNRQWKQGRLR